jgi:sterol desaturase/sphingolipid hydroxylase (fatty acid hydroxylase superfamily)
VVTSANFVLSLFIGQWWFAAFAGVHLFDGASLGTAGGAIVGVMVYEFFHYWYHRSAHRFNGLWRLGHQMHHSAESLDPWGAYFLHPLDAAIFLSLSSIVLYPLLGLSPAAGAWATGVLTFLAVFQHARVKTPVWLGYLVQRPESHAVHHARGVHAHNYADVPLWDMVFGTFRNPGPGAVQPLQGFYEGASARVAEMLAFRDITPPAGSRSDRRS